VQDFAGFFDRLRGGKARCGGGLGALISAGWRDEHTSINLRRRRAAGVAGLRRLKAATTLGWEHIDAFST